MSLQTALFERLRDDSGVGAEVGNRITHSVLKESETLPAITYQRIGGSPGHHMGGSTGLFDVNIQISCYADTPLAANDAAEAVLSSLDKFSGTMGTTNTAAVRDSILESSVDTVEPSASNKHKHIYGVNQSWTFWHR